MALPMRLQRAALPELGEMISPRDFESMINRFFGQSLEGGFTPYGVDIREDANHIYVDAEVPGFKKDEVDISMENQVLTISAHKKVQEEQKKPDYLLHERRYESFVRSFTLPSTVNDQNVQAKLNNGILEITLNKKEEAKPKKIQVS